MNPEGDFEFSLSNTNRIRPKHLKKLDFPNLVKNTSKDKIEEMIKNLSREDFQSNEYFEMSKEESGLVTYYQFLTQYMMHSIQKLRTRNETVNELMSHQVENNKTADIIIDKQRKKIRELELITDNITENSQSFEFLLNTMDLQHVVDKAGLSQYRTKEEHLISKPIIEKVYEKIQNDIIENINEINNIKMENSNIQNSSEFKDMSNFEDYSENFENDEIDISNNN